MCDPVCNYSLFRTKRLTCYTESDYDDLVAYCYPKQGMADRLLRVHIQIPAGVWAWVSLNNA